jgi:hypothetical protein
MPTPPGGRRRQSTDGKSTQASGGRHLPSSGGRHLPSADERRPGSERRRPRQSEADRNQPADGRLQASDGLRPSSDAENWLQGSGRLQGTDAWLGSESWRRGSDNGSTDSSSSRRRRADEGLTGTSSSRLGGSGSRSTGADGRLAGSSASWLKAPDSASAEAPGTQPLRTTSIPSYTQVPAGRRLGDPPPRPATQAPPPEPPEPPERFKRSEDSPGLARAVLFAILLLALSVPVALYVFSDRGDTADQAVNESLPVGADDRLPTNPDSTKPSAMPSATPTPSERPTATPTATPTSERSESTVPRDPTRSQSVGPTRATTGPVNPPTQPPSSTQAPSPTDDGSMFPRELELFNLIDNARVDRGCARLKRDSDLTGNARSYAENQAGSGSNTTGGGTDAIAEANSPNAAFDALQQSYSGVLFDCGRDTLGIGFADVKPGVCDVVPVCTHERRWVADFS